MEVVLCSQYVFLCLTKCCIDAFFGCGGLWSLSGCGSSSWCAGEFVGLMCV